MGDLVLEAGPVAVVGVAVGAALAAWFLYRVWHGVGGLRRAGRWALGAVRFVVLAVVGGLLLQPLIRQVVEDVERPVAIVLVDDSRSVTMEADSVEVAAALRGWTEGARLALQERGLEAEVYRFAGGVAPEAGDLGWQGDRTDVSGALAEVKDRFEHRNVKGVVLVSDGRVNRGVDPEYGAEGLTGVPLWTVGVGDTTDRADRWVAEVACNRVAYLGNRFPMEAVVGFRGAATEPVEVTVEHAGQTLARTTWTPSSSEDVTRLSWTLEASQLGTQRYVVRCAVGADERLTLNNQATVYVDVLERRKTVVVAARAPHPDLGHVIAALAQQDAYDLRLHYERLPHPDWLTNLNEAELIIAHDLEADSPWLQDLVASDAPVWWMASDAPSLAAFSSLNLGASFTSRGLKHRVGGAPTVGFTLFQWPEAAARAFSAQPPLSAPLGEWTLSPAWHPALQTRLGDLVTDEPLMAFRHVNGDRRWAFTAGSGWWNLRMSEGLESASPTVLDGWVTSTVQYLTSRSDVRRFRITAPKRTASDEAVVLGAEVYDAALNPLAGAEVTTRLVDAAGNELNGVFVESGGRYRMDWGRLAPGVYTWQAETLLDGEWQRAEGELAVETSVLEWTAERADHGMLLRLAERMGGAFLGTLGDEATQPAAVADRLVAASGNEPIVYEEVTLMDAVELEWIAALLIALLTVEWVFRRRTVGY